MGSIYWRSKLAHVCSFGARHYVRVPSKLLNWRSHSILGAAMETACLFISRLLLFSLAPCRPDAVRAIAQLHAVVLANSPRVKRRAVLVLVPARHANEGYQLAVTERLAGGVPYPAFEAPSRPFWAIPSTTISTTPPPRPSTTTPSMDRRVQQCTSASAGILHARLNLVRGADTSISEHPDRAFPNFYLPSTAWRNHLATSSPRSTIPWPVLSSLLSLALARRVPRKHPSSPFPGSSRSRHRRHLPSSRR